MIKLLLSTFLFAIILADDNYFIGSPYKLNIPDSANITNDEYQVLLVYGNEEELPIPGGANIKPGVSTAQLGAIDLYRKTDSLLINQSEPGFIQVLDTNTSTIIINQSVAILQSIMVVDQLSNPVQIVGEQLLITGIEVSKQLYHSLSNPIWIASIIEVSDDTWMPLQIFNRSTAKKVKHSRRLLSKHLYTQYYPNKKKYIVNDIACDGEELYCKGNLTFSVPLNSVLGGPHIVNLMISDGYNTSSNVFTVIGRQSLSDGVGISDKDKLIVYSPSNVNVLLKNISLKTSTMNPVPYYYYEKGELDINITGLDEGVCLYITLKNYTDNEFIARCDSAPVNNFKVLDWRFKDNANLRDTKFDIANGTYEVNIYLDADCEGQFIPAYIFELDALNVLHVEIQEYQESVNSTNSIMPVIIQPVNITNLDQYVAGDTPSLAIVTSFSVGTIIKYYFETCDTNNCTILNTTQGPPLYFNYSRDDVRVPVALPGGLKLTKHQYNITNNIVFLISSCDGETVLESKQELIIIEKPSDNSPSTLSAGAIVGIVCAGVLLCGLAAWWICMRKSGSSNYKPLDE